jgi:uncharacterized protein YqjF (DUF2071 family)
MFQEWRHILFLHWAFPPAAIGPLLPPGLTLDTFEGRAYVGLVPFTMSGIRPTWAPAVPWLSAFHEVNVRTYVHLGGRDPGVWFFSLDAANPVAVMLARRLWHLPYHRARMTMRVDAGSGTVHYRSRRLWPGPRPADLRVRYQPSGPPEAARPGTLEHFLAERYILYARRGEALFLGRVHHEPYPLQPAKADELEEGLLAAAGIDRPIGPPLAHYAAGVRVRIFPLGPAGGPATNRVPFMAERAG